METLHPNQIPTKLKYIDDASFQYIRPIYPLLKCLVSESGSKEQKINMIVAAVSFERISCLVYKGSDKKYYSKPDASWYCRRLFEGPAETPEEVYDLVKRHGVTLEKAKHIHKMIWQIADIVCPMIACVSEQAFISEYAYAIEYVIKHDGNIPKPEMQLLFPRNYPDFHYMEGIAAEIMPYTDGL